jgi:conjugal transfer pilus assembly protein TraF
MKAKIFKKTILICCICSALSSVSIQANDRFIDRKAEGWFWYKANKQSEPQEPQPLTAIPETASPEQAEPKETATVEMALPTTNSTSKAPKVFSVQWFSENLPKYRDRALENPTVENVTAYRYLLRYATDKSTQFAKTWSLTVGDPISDEIANAPDVATGVNIAKEKAKEETQQTLKYISSQSRLLIVINEKDQASLITLTSLKALARNSNFQIIVVSPYDQYTNLKKDETIDEFIFEPKVLEKLNIVTLPSLYLLTKDKNGNMLYHAIAQGVTGANDLETRVLRVALRDSIISDEQYNKCFPTFKHDNSLASKISPDFLESDFNKENSDGSTNDTNFIEPEEIIYQFRKDFYKKDIK